ncbi:MAG TPA: cupredoxin domain-containing protein [Bacteriovoracaceae bacterium]|nr:cupredoxin domain-containing protein [Bacteriovoracaceae bacterium]
MKFLVILILMSLQAFAVEVKKTPTREVAIIVTKEGYYPKSISVFEGEMIKFYVTSTVEEPNCMIVESHKVFLAANKGKITEGEAFFDKAGEFAFYCPSSKNDGKIVVIKKQVPKREIASEKGRESMIWTPKEY